MQRSVQHTTLQGAQQSQSRSALVSQRFAGNQACFCSCLLPVFCFLGVPRVLGCRHDAGERESGSIRKVLSTQLLPCSVGYDRGWCQQNPALAGLKRPREALATPSASVAPSPAVGRQGGLLTPGFRPQNGVQPLRLRTPGVQNSGIAPLRSLGSSVAAGKNFYYPGGAKTRMSAH